MLRITFLAILALGLTRTAFAVTYVVDSTSAAMDSFDGRLTLPEAVFSANTVPGADVIEFAEGLTGTISLNDGLSITDDLAIAGPGPDLITLSLQTDGGYAAIQVSSSASNFELSGLRLKRAGGRSGPLDIRSDTVVLEDLEIEGAVWFVRLFDPTNATLQDVTIRDSVAGLYISQYGNQDSSILIDGLLYIDGKSHGQANLLQAGLPSESGGSMDITLRNSRITNSKEADFGVNADGISLTMEKVTFDNNGQAYLSLRTDEAKQIVNSTFYLNENLFIYGSGKLDITSSTFYNNGVFRDGVVKYVNGEGTISHTVMSKQFDGTVDLFLDDSDVDVDYSMLSSASTISGNPPAYDAASTNLLTQIGQFEATFESFDQKRFFLLPSATSNLLDAGNATATAGNELPLTDQAGSERIIGSAPDIGAIERNYPPFFDRDALEDAIKEARESTPEGEITIDLTPYAFDVDGDAIIDIQVSNLNPGLSFNDSTWSVTGESSAFDKPVWVVSVTDEHGLQADYPLEKRGGSAVVADGGSSGGHSGWLLLPLLLAGIRAKSASDT